MPQKYAERKGRLVMGNLFKVDGLLYKLMSIITDAFVLTFLWILCSLPLITIGASTTAVFSVTLKMVRGEETYIARGFFKAFKSNFKKATQLWIVYAGTGAALGYLIWLYQTGMENVLPKPLYYVVLMGAIIYVISLLYVFPLTARYENTISQTMKNSLLIALRYNFRTLQILFVFAALVVIGMWNTTTLFFLIVLGAGLIMYILSIYFRLIFDHLEANIDKEQEEAKERIAQKKSRTYAVKEEEETETESVFKDSESQDMSADNDDWDEKNVLKNMTDGITVDDGEETEAMAGIMENFSIWSDDNKRKGKRGIASIASWVNDDDDDDDDGIFSIFSDDDGDDD